MELPRLICKRAHRQTEPDHFNSNGHEKKKKKEIDVLEVSRLSCFFSPSRSFFFFPAGHVWKQC